jgi:glutamate synthase (NADPH/NADH)
MLLGAASVVNFELLPQPPVHRAQDNPWPEFPRVFKVDYGHSEVQKVHGKDPRQYCVMSKEFVSDGNGRVAGINTVRVDWTKDSSGRWQMKEIPGSEEFFKADLILLALGFLAPEQHIIQRLQLKTDGRKNIQTTRGQYSTTVDGVYAAGDCRRGQSLIVWGIDEGRQAAREIDQYLTTSTLLPVTGGIVKVELGAGVRESLVQVR